MCVFCIKKLFSLLISPMKGNETSLLATSWQTVPSHIPQHKYSSILKHTHREGPPETIITNLFHLQKWGEDERTNEGDAYMRVKYAEGNIWLRSASASSRLIGLLRGQAHQAHQSPGSLFPEVCLEALAPKTLLMTAYVKDTIPLLVSVYKSSWCHQSWHQHWLKLSQVWKQLRLHITTFILNT